MHMPNLETERLRIRPFTLEDLDAYHRMRDAETRAGAGAQTYEERRQWLQWTVLNYEQLARLNQPPLGDRAVVLKDSGGLVGACGYVPCLNAFGQLPGFGARPPGTGNRLEWGLFYAIAPAHRRQGYATEAAQAMIDYAFQELRLARVVATTSYDNTASMGVMRKLGMRVERNPHPDPPYLQVVGILEKV